MGEKARTITFQPMPFLIDKIDELVKSGEFRNRSQVINTALIEFFAKREMKTTYKKEGVRE